MEEKITINARMPRCPHCERIITNKPYLLLHSTLDGLMISCSHCGNTFRVAFNYVDPRMSRLIDR